MTPRPYYNHLKNIQIGLVYLLNYGGGLVYGDQLVVEMEVNEQCHLLCLSQGSTKGKNTLGFPSKKELMSCPSS